MYINAHTIIITLIVIVVACYGGLHFVRKFALQIAQENHDAIVAMDNDEDEKRHKRELAADQAAASAFAKVQPILSLHSNIKTTSTTTAHPSGTKIKIPTAPASGSIQILSSTTKSEIV